MHAQGPDGRGGRVKTAKSALSLRILSNNAVQPSTSGKLKKVSSHSMHMLVTLTMSRNNISLRLHRLRRRWQGCHVK